MKLKLNTLIFLVAFSIWAVRIKVLIQINQFA